MRPTREICSDVKLPIVGLRAWADQGALVPWPCALCDFWAQRVPPEGRGTCKRLTVFYFVLGATWASWSRDTCERLSGVYFVLGATLASWSRDIRERPSVF